MSFFSLDFCGMELHVIFAFFGRGAAATKGCQTQMCVYDQLTTSILNTMNSKTLFACCHYAGGVGKPWEFADEPCPQRSNER